MLQNDVHLLLELTRRLEGAQATWKRRGYPGLTQILIQPAQTFRVTGTTDGRCQRVNTIVWTECSCFRCDQQGHLDRVCYLPPVQTMTIGLDQVCGSQVSPMMLKEENFKVAIMLARREVSAVTGSDLRIFHHDSFWWTPYETTEQEFGKNLYTLKEVVSEIRDKETKKRLAFLPYKLELKEPLPEYVKLVTEFSKKTGDYPSLSATDIKVLALTYQLEAEHVGVSHLKKEPEVKNTTEKPSNICSNLETLAPVDTEFNSFQFWRNPLPNIEAELLELLEFNEPQKTKHTEEKYSEEDEGIDGEDDDQGREDFGHNSDDEDDDGGGWITPSNIKQIQQEMGYSEIPAQVTVGCLTTDFAMQHSLPKPQGGKHAHNPHLVEDQRFPQQRLSRKARKKTNVLDPDYIAGVSPFCENDVYSRAANLNIRDERSGAGRRRINPNMAGKKNVKRK
ncbi:NOB1 protein, partial [Polypterus senegalus]